MEYKNYYQILGINRNASEKEIKQAYRKLARQLHPDVNPGNKSAEARFKEINEAYEVLGDPEKRVKYDRLGSSYQQWQRSGRDPGGFDWSQWFTPGSGRSPQGGVRVEFSNLNDLFGNGQAGGFSDFFNSLFGTMPGAARQRSDFRRGYNTPTREKNIEQSIDITLQESYTGTTRTLLREGQRIEAKIPAGADTGTKVRLAGQGAPGSAGKMGDLLLKITVLPHEYLQREGDDLHMDKPVSLYTAVLGGEVPITTLNGEIRLKIPPGTQNGTVFRLRGKGMPVLRKPGRFGDLYTKISIQIPENLSVAETELFQKLAAFRTR